jgi:lysophospholipase L1-like esterase
MTKMAAANQAIKTFLVKQKNTGFIDVYHHMLTADGKPMEQLFLGDRLHMNASGYRIWQRLILPNLLSNK